MAQTVSLAPGQTSADSANIVVAAGAEAVIGIYTETGTKLAAAGANFVATVYQVTPGEPNAVAKLSASESSMVVAGPNTFYVARGACPVNVGVFSE